LRLGLIIAGNALGSLAGNGVDFGAIKIGGPYAASPWKWIYVILGPCAMAVGIATLLILPSTPVKAWFLTPRERKIAILRLRSNNTGVHTRKFKWKQALSTFLDPQLWALLFFSFTFSFSNVAISRYVTG
jgi:ACS family allantoate permease-like MFS transporter